MRTLAALFALAFLAWSVSAGEPLNDFESALRQAKDEGKLLFIEFGRRNCKLCDDLKAMIKSGQVQIPDSKYVRVYLDCDKKRNAELIDEKFKIKAHKLPFVVITDAEGDPLSIRTGFGTASDYMEFIDEAERLAAAAKRR